uniref:Uncharacterized protein n=2 Tax=Aliivibrio wodanis TaxID=80852 RepID=A0A5Q4ZYX8_9GAMM|nr:hypothetical protein AW0309160_04544 [Aliivibrio wodanis]
MKLKDVSEKLMVRKVEINGKSMTLQKVKNLPLVSDDWLDDYRAGYSHAIAKVSSHIVHDQINKRFGKFNCKEQPYEFKYGLIIHHNEALFLAVVLKCVKSNFSFSSDRKSILSRKAILDKELIFHKLSCESLSDDEYSHLEACGAEINEKLNMIETDLNAIETDLVNALNELDLINYIDL